MEDNMEEDNHSSSSEEKDDEEVPWYDYLVRRPNDIDIKLRSKDQLPAPTEVFTSTYPKAQRDGKDIKLMLKGYRMGSDQTMVSSGLTEWKATSDVLCNYLLNDDDIKRERTGEFEQKEFRMLELGSGLGKCGLLVHLLLQSNGYMNATILTDGDTNVLRLLQKNISFNTFSDHDNDISCEQLKWGKDEAEEFLSQLEDDGISDYNNQRFDLILGSDLLYTERKNIYLLMNTVAVLLDLGGKFILAHNEEHSIPVEWLKEIAIQKNMFCEVLKQEGQIYLLCFRKLALYKVNSMAERLYDKIAELESKVRTLEVNQAYAEDKILRLDERCTVLRGDDDLPKSILLSLDEDNLASILSFLEPQDFAQMASTCKRFGLRKHAIGTEEEHVSLMKKIAYKIYEGASTGEKEALSLYQAGYSPFFLHNELNRLRKPLKFDQLFGRDIQHVFGDRSIIKPTPRHAGIKAAPHARRTIHAFTAVSDHVMRAGKHYVTFTSSGLDSLDDHLLWFGVVRPLKQFTPDSSFSALFTPFSENWADDLRELQCPEWGDSNIHSCVYRARDGQCKSTDWVFEEGNDDEHEDTLNVTNEAWQGMQMFEGCGKIGLLLDYDEGTLTVYKNDIKLGIMKEGLSGAYCWMVTVGMDWGDAMFTSASKARIKIERGPHPEDYKVPQEKRPRIE